MRIDLYLKNSAHLKQGCGLKMAIRHVVSMWEKSVAFRVIYSLKGNLLDTSQRAANLKVFHILLGRKEGK